ncbi:MAG TPA: DNA polymerase/3'-5' exonuclease PolX [Phycisphaerales bacterium]|nr:DNA polymerase/3'-5' exonuclease PolX [Phycisphaerales bacterium]HCD30901.1 DNA polymerase/3'-5' exonuclease PolX [Phycisphaerales bacterium]|tara:strand:+ start:2084 stop:3817 length:1734 start_codon:yes stop_codon:yes gene_type:complete
MDTNHQLAAIFQQMADVHTILEDDRFRINAYAKAARVIGELPTDLADIGAEVALLAKVEGIGKSTASKIAEFLQTGKIKAHEDVMQRIPHGLLDLLQVSGLGPKTVGLMWNQAGIESMEDLKEKLKTDELTALPRMGKKSLDKIRKSIAFMESTGGRVNIGKALPIALWFIDQLKTLKQVTQVQYAGSLRRGKETIGDLDLLVAAREDDSKTISDFFIQLPVVTEVLAQGQTKSSVRTEHGVQVDLRIVDPQHFGAALMYFTGSKEHNVAMRQRAIKMGMSLNEYALTKDDKPIAAKTEEDVFKALDLQWVAPEMREDHGELALAENNKLPKLVEVADVKAELHAHTTASDGIWSIEQYADFAIDLGFHTIAITDHSKGQAQANGLNEQRLIDHIEKIRAAAKKYQGRLTILAGSEVDILSDGSLDYADDLLAQLDIVVASPHAALTQEPKVATQRMLKAIENPYVTIMGHPTGRLINRREGLSPDMPKLIAAARERGIAMEINANHWRLDLRDSHARLALESGVKLAIDTDAHGPGDMDELKYGILTARRAGATAGDVVNCMSHDQLSNWLKSTRP